ncbi:MAG: hypothetical protein N2749_00775 [Clostridia bacterium]|nr:hypothetical protein [Clostridia bacterium]
MSIQNAYRTIQKGIEFYSGFDNVQVLINLCILKKVYPHNLTADVFIPKTSMRLFNVPILFPYLGLDSGIIIMPKENSPAIIIKTSDSKHFIISSVNNFFSEDNPFKILDGENIIFSPSKILFKQDSVGNQIFMSGGGSTNILTKNNEIIDYSFSKISKTTASKTIVGTTNISNNTSKEVVALEYSQVYNKIKKIKTYSKDDILVVDDKENISVNDNIKQEIISSSNKIIENIREFFDDINSFKNKIMKNPYMSKEDIEKNVLDIKTKLYNKYSTEKKACITIEKGAAIKKNIDNLYELSKLTLNDIETSQEGNMIVFRLKVSDNDGNVVAALTFDECGNVKLKCKDFKIEQI